MHQIVHAIVLVGCSTLNRRAYITGSRKVGDATFTGEPNGEGIPVFGSSPKAATEDESRLATRRTPNLSPALITHRCRSRFPPQETVVTGLRSAARNTAMRLEPRSPVYPNLPAVSIANPAA